MKMFEDAFFIAPFLVSSGHEMFVQENRSFFAGGYRRISPVLRVRAVLDFCKIYLQWNGKRCFDKINA